MKRSDITMRFPRTWSEAYGLSPQEANPFQRFTKPLYKRLSFWLITLTVCAVTAIYLGVKYA